MDDDARNRSQNAVSVVRPDAGAQADRTRPADGPTSRLRCLVALFSKCAISAFILANISTVVIVNLPESAGAQLARRASLLASPETVYRLRQANWYLRSYAHLVGLDNRWQMFGRQSRFNWWYVIKARYADGAADKVVVLPLPRQSARTVAQRWFFDFKEAKFHLNVYSDPIAREAYARYLMRTHATHDSMTIKSIKWELWHQSILTPEDSVLRQQLVDQRCFCQTLDEFQLPDCADEPSPQHSELTRPQVNGASTESDVAARPAESSRPSRGGPI